MLNDLRDAEYDISALSLKKLDNDRWFEDDFEIEGMKLFVIRQFDYILKFYLVYGEIHQVYSRINYGYKNKNCMPIINDTELEKFRQQIKKLRMES